MVKRVNTQFVLIVLPGQTLCSKLPPFKVTEIQEIKYRYIVM